MFEGFTRKKVATSGAEINLVEGGSGPPLLLLHGNPLTYVMWHKVAPFLAAKYSVVASDLRGYGDSSKPDGGADHSGYSFRTMGNDQVEVMAALGHEKFFIAGHDRGARVGHRLALDHPDKILGLITLDIVPTHHVLTNITKGWAQESYHWFFMSQNAPFPEEFLGRDLEGYMRYKLNKKGVGLSPFTDEAMAEYIRCCTPENIHAVCEDYRATLTVDFDLDSQDFGKKFIECPLLVQWGENSHVGRHFDPVAAWRPWTKGPMSSHPLPAGHYPAEQYPDETFTLISDFLDEYSRPAA